MELGSLIAAGVSSASLLLLKTRSKRQVCSATGGFALPRGLFYQEFACWGFYQTNM